jgi:hypothetical protein
MKPTMTALAEYADNLGWLVLTMVPDELAETVLLPAFTEAAGFHANFF